MKMQDLLIIGGGIAALAYVASAASGSTSPGRAPPSPTSPVSVDLNAVKNEVIAGFIPDTNKTLSPEGQLHNEISRVRGLVIKKSRDANQMLKDPGTLKNRLRAGLGTAYLSFSELVELAKGAGIIHGVEVERRNSSGRVLRYRVIT